jgi:pSer/pThr/pTyr-binding forkhead associated (FHA) protein
LIIRLLEVQRALLVDAKGFAALYSFPVLLWAGQPRPPSDDDERESSTQSGGAARPASGEVLVVAVQKQGSKANAFAMGITIGRVATNDVVLDDASISRFHAYLQHDDRKDTWSLTDAGSQNGTQLNGKRIEGHQPIESGARLQFGDVVTWFLLPEQFRAWVEAGAALSAL